MDESSGFDCQCQDNTLTTPLTIARSTKQVVTAAMSRLSPSDFDLRICAAIVLYSAHEFTRSVLVATQTLYQFVLLFWPVSPQDISRVNLRCFAVIRLLVSAGIGFAISLLVLIEVATAI